MPHMQKDGCEPVYYHPIDCVEMLKVGWTILRNDFEGVKHFPHQTETTIKEDTKEEKPKKEIPDGASLAGGKDDDVPKEETEKLTAKQRREGRAKEKAKKAEAEAKGKAEGEIREKLQSEKAKTGAKKLADEKEEKERKVREAAQKETDEDKTQ